MPTLPLAAKPDPVITTTCCWVAGLGVTEQVAVLGGGVDPPPFFPPPLPAPRAASALTARTAETKIALTASIASIPRGFLSFAICLPSFRARAINGPLADRRCSRHGITEVMRIFGLEVRQYHQDTPPDEPE